ncbi:putative zinc-type alcohol dehydrogenase-like protein YogA [Daldinia childiae]|uniref:putative zinc-type alcohol dehydrogenase-like protein YogA n=1 Tax=Daldinia childiae TaxID=326645 RepID=UPI001444AB41|nr:putative zinc-type alcohol dehydrogenase-like protein YogA [Daldinia childiae]KAF3055849.1 putative zinc-type alcohol dehydrogenase-like protein YogA [Daldinia childiae]
MPQALIIKKVDGKPGQVYYPLQIVQVPKPKPGPNEVLIRIHTAALNHRDFFIRQHLYPGISFTNPLLADGFGTVVESGPGSHSAALLGQKVVLTPSRGWSSSPAGPEDPSKFSVIGGTTLYTAGAGQDFVLVPADEVELAPPHLSPPEAAAFPLVGLTAWRALVMKGFGGDITDVAGRNVLVTGIGGGVALCTLQFATALGCNVYVTSGDASKLERARALGAKGGISYKEAGWEKQLAAQLPASRPYLDLVVDGAGGDIVAKTVRLLKAGGVISIYGMTVGPKMDWLMQAVMKNVDLRGTTMGSRAEFRDMVEFVRKHQIRPVVSRVVKGLDNLKALDDLFEDIRHGKQFGKLVIEISSPDEEAGSKL